MTQDIMYDALADIAEKLNAEIASRQDGITAVVSVKASAVLSLGFDDGEEITADSLRRAISENLLDIIRLTASDGSSLDSAELVEVRTEI